MMNDEARTNRRPSPRTVALSTLRTAIPLMVMWQLLWQRVDPVTVLSGAIVALTVTRVARLPHLAGDARTRPVRALRATGTFAVDLFVSSIILARTALWRPGQVKGAVVGVPMMTRTETTLALTAADLTLRPGSLVLDVDRHAALLYVHGMPVRDEGDVARIRAEVTATERRLVEVFGSTDDVRAVQRSPEEDR